MIEAVYTLMLIPGLIELHEYIYIYIYIYICPRRSGVKRAGRGEATNSLNGEQTSTASCVSDLMKSHSSVSLLSSSAAAAGRRPCMCIVYAALHVCKLNILLLNI